MKKILICLVSLIMCSACSNTEYDVFSSFHGVVCDYETGEPLPGVSVVLSPGGATNITGSDGHFDFQELTPQKYTITAQKAGYATNRKSVNAVSGENTEINITLTKHE